MSKLANKIEANDRNVREVLDKKKYTVDYFQREYRWGQKHIEQLVTDLTSSFLNEYREGDSRETVSFRRLFNSQITVGDDVWVMI